MLLKVPTIRILSCGSQRQRRRRATRRSFSFRRADFHFRFLPREERRRVDQPDNRATSRSIPSTRSFELELHRTRNFLILFFFVPRFDPPLVSLLKLYQRLLQIQIQNCHTIVHDSSALLLVDCKLRSLPTSITK